MQLSTTPEELQKAFRAIAAIVLVVLVTAGVTVAVRASYGAFSDDMKITTTFARAGQALHPGSDVKYRGVNVGKVRSVRLRHRRVEVVLQLRKTVEVPASTSASVRAKTLFGEKFVELATSQGDKGPYLRDGDKVRSGGTGTEVDELVDSTDRLFRAVDVQELATLMDQLTRAYQGEGNRVARLIDKSVGAADAFDDTLEAQLRAVDSFKRFTREYRDVGPSLNGISRNLNELLPTFNAARADYERLLETLTPFSDHLADFVELNEADIDQIMDEGDNIVRVLTARKAEISESIRGLARYTYVLANAVSKETLPDGSKLGYLKLFIDVGDLQALLCAALGPSGPVPELSQVREALAAASPQLACDGDAGVGSNPRADGGVPKETQAPSGGADDPATDLTNTVAGAVGHPDQAVGTGSVNSLLTPLLAGAG